MTFDTLESFVREVKLPRAYLVGLAAVELVYQSVPVIDVPLPEGATSHGEELRRRAWEHYRNPEVNADPDEFAADCYEWGQRQGFLATGDSLIDTVSAIAGPSKHELGVERFREVSAVMAVAYLPFMQPLKVEGMQYVFLSLNKLGAYNRMRRTNMVVIAAEHARDAYEGSFVDDCLREFTNIVLREDGKE